MNVNPGTAKHSYEHAGKKYYFCCGGCASKSSQPILDKYLNKPASSALVTLGMAPKSQPQ